jgi:hypothetical protein
MGMDTGPRQGRSGHAGRQVARLLGAILDPAARRRGFAEASLLADWIVIVGPALARRCRPLRVDHAPGKRRGGTLLVQASGAVAIEIQHAAPQIVERINTYFGFPAVRQLRLLQMPLRPPAPPAPRPRPLGPDEEAALAARVTGVADGELREALLALGRALRGGTGS